MSDYEFVEFIEEPISRKKTPSNHNDISIGLLSGKLTCKLTALSPILIPSLIIDNDQDEGFRQDFLNFYEIHGKKVIPASTLKGMLRATAEALTNSCVSIFSGEYVHTFDNQIETASIKLPNFENIQTCSNIHALCPACRIFGMASGFNTADNLFYRGKISISDGVAESWIYDNPTTIIKLESPRPAREKIYQKENFARGRKFYPHTENLEIKTDNKNDRGNIRPLKRGTQFEFTVFYKNLEEHELAILIQTIVLESGLKINGDNSVTFSHNHPDKNKNGVYHKIGYGKPAGLGSCHIQITSCEVLNLYDRYTTSGSGINVQTNTNLQNWIQKYKQIFYKEFSIEPKFNDVTQLTAPAYVKQLYKILCWPKD